MRIKTIRRWPLVALYVAVIATAVVQIASQEPQTANAVGGCSAGYTPVLTSLVQNGDFAISPTTIYPAGYSSNDNTVPGYYYSNGMFYSQMANAGDDVYPDDITSGTNIFSNQHGPFVGDPNVSQQDSLNQLSFPGDPRYGLPAVETWQYTNGNFLNGGEYVNWGQTINGLIPGKTYVFTAYISSVIEPPGDGPDDSIIQFKLGGSPGLPDGIAVGTPTVVTEAGTANTQPLNGWQRISFSFSAPGTSTVLKVTDTATGTWGDDFAMTAIGVSACEPIPDYTTSISHQGTPVAGGTYEQTVTIGNVEVGGQTSAGHEVTITLPTDFTVNSGSAGPVTLTGNNGAYTCTSDAGSPQVLTCDSDSLVPYGGTGSVSFDVDIAPGAPTSSTINATVSLVDEVNLVNNPSQETITLQPDVKGYEFVTYTDNNSNGLINPGDQLDYTIVYRNTGGSTESNFQITDSLPANTSFVPGSLSVTPSGAGQTGSANAGYDGNGTSSMLAAPVTLEVDGVLTVTYSVIVDAGYIGSVNDQATASGDTVTNVLTDGRDESPSGECAVPSGLTAPTGSISQSCTAGLDPVVVNIVENLPTVTVGKTDGQTTVDAGGQLTYTITVQNTATDSTAANLTVDDVLPANTTFVSASNGGTENAGTVSWTIASLAGGASAVRTVTVDVVSTTPDATVLTNDATVDSTSDTGLCARSGSDCTASDTTTVSNQPVLTVTKTDGQTSAAPGDTLVYTIEAANTATGSFANGLTLTDTLPGDVTFVSASDGGSESGGVVTWSIANIAGGASLTRTVTVQVNAGATNGSTLSNSATVAMPTDPDACTRTGASCTATDQTTVNNPPVMTIAKTDNATSVTAGSNLTYEITVTNNTAGSTATNLQVSDTLPAETSFVSATSGGTESGGVVSWTIASLAGGASTTVEVVVQVGAATSDGTNLSNSVTMSSPADSGMCARSGADCDDTDTTLVENQAEIVVSKTDNQMNAEPGDTLTYDVTVANTSVGSSAADIVLSDTLPANVSFVSATGGGTESGGVVSWTIGSIAGGANATRTVVVQVNAGVTDGTVLTNSAAANSTTDTDICTRPGSSCTATDQTTVDHLPVVTISKTDAQTSASRGQQLTYTVTIENTATGSIATNLVVSDTLPGLVDFVSASDGGTHSAGVVTWNIPSLAGGSSLTRTITTTVNNLAFDGDNIQNDATVSSTDDAQLCTYTGADCTAPDTTAVAISPVLTVQKDDSRTTAQPGDSLTYTIDIANTEPGSTATNIVITDTLPADVNFVSATGGGTYANGDVTWNVASLAGGGNASRTVTVQVAAGATDGSTLQNSVAIAADQTEACTNPGAQCSATDQTTVDNPPIISIAKTDNQSSVVAGGNLTYEVTVTNSALGSTAADVVLNDTVPANTSFVSANSGGTESGGEVTWTIGDIAGGDSVTREVVVQVGAATSDGTIITNNASVESTSDSGLCVRPGNTCTASDTTAVNNLPIVTIAKTDNTSQAQRGQQLTYTIVLENPKAGSTATGLVVTDTLPANVNFVSASDGGTHSSGEVTWNIASLAGVGTVTRSVTVEVNNQAVDGETLQNDVVLSSTDDAGLCGRAGSDCTDSDTTDIAIPPVLTVTKSDGLTNANPGDTITYTVNTSNTEPGSSATNVVVTDTLPDHVDFVSASNGGTESNGSVVWNIPSIDGGDSAARTVTVTLQNSAPHATVLTNNVSITADQTSACTGPGAQCSSSDQTTVAVLPNVTVSITDNQTNAARGQQLTHAIVVDNPGQSQSATDLVLTDTLPAGTTFVSATDGGTHSGGVVTWTIPSIAGGSTITRSVVVTVNNTANNGDTLQSDAAISSTSDTGICARAGSDCTDSDTTAVAIPPVLTVTTDDNTEQASAGDEITYSLVARNTALGSTANSVDLSSTLPSEVTFVSASDGGTFSNGVVSWNLGTMVGGATVTRSITVRVNQEVADGYVLHATASVSAVGQPEACSAPGASCNDVDQAFVLVPTEEPPLVETGQATTTIYVLSAIALVASAALSFGRRLVKT